MDGSISFKLGSWVRTKKNEYGVISVDKGDKFVVAFLDGSTKTIAKSKLTLKTPPIALLMEWLREREMIEEIDSSGKIVLHDFHPGTWITYKVSPDLFFGKVTGLDIDNSPTVKIMYADYEMIDSAYYSHNLEKYNPSEDEKLKFYAALIGE